MPRGIYKRGVVIRKPHSAETKLKMSLSSLGKPKSKEHKDKIRLVKTGVKYPNRKRYAKGLTPIQKTCLFCKKEFITNCFMPRKKYCSMSCRAKANPRTFNKLARERQIESARKQRGENHPNWKGGRSKSYKTGYYSTEYKEWRIKVFERDGYKCQSCGITGTYITAHHIKSFAHYPELRFELGNGVTLCEPCHSLTDNYKGRNKGKGKLTKL